MRSDKLLLEEIIEHCDGIIDDVAYYGDDIESFYEEPRFQRSCSFGLFQKGECVKSLSPLLKERHPQVSWRQIAGLRDIIGHGYHHINLDEMWTTIVNDVPILKKECESILSQIE